MEEVPFTLTITLTLFTQGGACPAIPLLIHSVMRNGLSSSFRFIDRVNLLLSTEGAKVRLQWGCPGLGPSENGVSTFQQPPWVSRVSGVLQGVSKAKEGTARWTLGNYRLGLLVCFLVCSLPMT